MIMLFCSMNDMRVSKLACHMNEMRILTWVCCIKNGVEIRTGYSNVATTITKETTEWHCLGQRMGRRRHSEK